MEGTLADKGISGGRVDRDRHKMKGTSRLTVTEAAASNQKVRAAVLLKGKHDVQVNYSSR